MAKTRGRFKLTRKDKGLDKLKLALLEFGKKGGKQLKVGVFDTSKHPSGDITVAEVATLHEHGAPQAGIPQRSFLGATFDKNRRLYMALLRSELAQFYVGKTTIEDALAVVGKRMKTDVQRFISDDKVKPPHSASTIARKRAKGIQQPRTLIDTRTLLNAIDFKVENGSRGASR